MEKNNNQENTVVDLNFMRKQLSEGSNTEWKEYMQWLQQQRDIGLWIECCRKGCGKWRYVEEYHDPLGVPKEWFCEMNAGQINFIDDFYFYSC